MSSHNLCFEQKYEKCQKFLAENYHFLVAKLSINLNRHVFVVLCKIMFCFFVVVFFFFFFFFFFFSYCRMYFYTINI